ncbi:MAG: hypothetical protein WC865_02785 [Bacteroidales bacterium]
MPPKYLDNRPVAQYRLALLYDAPGENSYSHMRRSIGLAFLKLPLVVPGTSH